MRIINAFKLNPYEILELNMMPSYTVTETEIRSSAPSSLHFFKISIWNSVNPRIPGTESACTDKTYRKKSLLIHPDKLKHARGIEAFDLLKKVIFVPLLFVILANSILNRQRLSYSIYRSVS